MKTAAHSFPRPAQPAVPKLSLREEQKAVTRRRIQDAARELFYVNGYASTTIEQIALSAGTRRSTLYLHFHDKEDILRLIAVDYGVQLSAVIGTLSGPAPSRREIDAWILGVAEFVGSARMPTVLLSSLGNLADIPEPVRLLGDQLLSRLAVNHPAFRYAIEPGPRQPLAFAWASVALRELCWVCLLGAEPQEATLQQSFFSVVGDVMEKFLSDFA